MKKIKWLLILVLVLTGIYTAAVRIIPKKFDQDLNQTLAFPPYQVSSQALSLYNSLDFIADLHCDALLWDRDLTVKNGIGHVDFPRMQEANMALQAFTIVTKSPAGQNFRKNSADAFDNITLLNFLQARPLSNWFSLFERAVYQSQTLHEFAAEYDDTFILVKNKEDLNRLIAEREDNGSVLGGFLGIEGAHCLEGKIENLDKLYSEAG